MNTFGCSDFLYARPTFWEGVGRAMDISGATSQYNQSETGEIADRIALAADWRAVGQDLWQAMSDFATENGLPQPEALHNGEASETAGR